METLGDALARRRSKVEVPQCCFDGYGLEQVGSKGSAPESCPAGPVEESRTDAEGSKMNDEEEDEYSEYSEEYSSEGSGDEHVDVPSKTANKDVLNEEDEYSDESGSEGLEGEESEEEYSDEYSEDEYSEISADEAGDANKEAEKEDSREGDSAKAAPPCDSNEEVDKDTVSAEKEERSAQGSGEERVDVSSTGANKEVLKEDDEYSYVSGSEALEGEESEDDEYSDEDECSSQHSAAEYNDVNAGGAEADEASGANEEAKKEEPAEIMVSVPEGGDFMCPAPSCDLQEEADKDSGSAEKDDRPLEASGEERLSSTGANNGALNEKDEYSDGSGSEGLEGEEDEEDEYSDEDECSSQHSAAEHNDVIAGGVEADEASGANEEAEKEEPAEIMVSVPEGGDFMCPAPSCDLQEEADKDSGSAEKDDRPLEASGEERLSSTGANNGALNEKDEYSDGSGSEGLEGEEGEEDEYSDEEECSSQHSVAEYNDVIAGGAEEDDASEVDEQSSQHSVAEYNDMIASGPEADATQEAEKKEPPEDHASPDPTNPDPVCGSQDEVCDVQVGEQSSQHSVAEHDDVIT
ncbi:MDN1, partial [Symbiodinium sp. CCMP2456]